MNMATDISALQTACGGELMSYQEIVRDEKSANCRARWPLLVQTALGETVGLPIATDAVLDQSPSKGFGGAVSVRGAARFDGIVRPLAAAVGASPSAAMVHALAAAQASAVAAEHATPLSQPLPRLVSVVERGSIVSPVREFPKPKAMTLPPLRKPARTVAHAPRAFGVATSTASVAGSPRTGLSDLFKRLDAPQPRSAGLQR